MESNNAELPPANQNRLLQENPDPVVRLL